MPLRFCVFCGSSAGADPEYASAAAGLSRCLAARNISIVYGGSKDGLMGVVADAALAAGAEVIGVIPRALMAKEKAHPRLSDLRLVDTMHQRKALMAELSHGFIALPGGYGTLDEFCEILTWTQLGLERKPCGILNVRGYYDDLMRLFDHAVREQFLKQPHRDVILTDTDPSSLIDRMLSYEVPVLDKWIDRQDT